MYYFLSSFCFIFFISALPRSSLCFFCSSVSVGALIKSVCIPCRFGFCLHIFLNSIAVGGNVSGKLSRPYIICSSLSPANSVLQKSKANNSSSLLLFLTSNSSAFLPYAISNLRCILAILSLSSRLTFCDVL